MPVTERISLSTLAPITEQAIVSRILLKASGGSVTLFAFDAGEGLSEHTTTSNALAVVLEGTMTFTLDGVTHTAAGGDALVLPANVPHALHAPAPCRMLLCLLK